MFDDWTPIAQARHALGGLFGAGDQAVCQLGRDGLIDGVAALAISVASLEAEPERETDFALPALFWSFAARLGPLAPLWNGGAVEVPNSDGWGQTTLYDIRVRDAGARLSRPTAKRGRPSERQYPGADDELCAKMLGIIEEGAKRGERIAVTTAARMVAPEGKGQSATAIANRLRARYPVWYQERAT